MSWMSAQESSLDPSGPTFLALGIGFMEDNFSMDQGGGDGFRMIQVHYIYCVVERKCLL